jgi:nucleotide-binding universal stress UspA family protein
MFERILLAVDESHDVDQTTDAVAALAQAFSSEVTVLHVRERTVTAAGTIEKESIPRSFAFGQAVAGRLTDIGIKASAMIDSAQPRHLGRSILAKAEELDAGLIVIGGHRAHSLRERLFGDIAEVLAHSARCPVLLMPSVPAGEPQA